MTKPSKIRRKTVDLGSPQARTSRIRRDPPPAEKKVEPPSPQREVWTSVAGVVLVAIASTALIVGVGVVTIQRSNAAAARVPQFGQCYNHGPDCVLDGDTIYLDGAKLEIAGMDAPRIQGAECPEERSRGIEAAVKLVDLLNKGTVTNAGPEREDDGQLRTKIEVDGRDVGVAMVNAGLARDHGGGRRSWC